MKGQMKSTGEDGFKYSLKYGKNGETDITIQTTNVLFDTFYLNTK